MLAVYPDSPEAGDRVSKPHSVIAACRRVLAASRSAGYVAVLAAMAAVALALAASACSPGPSGEVYLYVAVPLTGDMASRGQEVAGGVRLRADEMNREGGVLGKRVIVRALDDGGDEEMALEAAREVAAAVRGGEPVLGVVGHYNSGATGPALDQVYKDLNVTVITPSSTNPTFTQKGYTRFFRVCSTDDIQGPVDARLAISLGWNRIAIFHTDNLYARGLADAFRGELRRQNVQPVFDQEMRYNDLGVFLRELPARVEAALRLSPDGVFFAGDYPEGIPLLETLRNSGYGGGFMSGDSMVEYEFIDVLGSKAEGAIITNTQPELRAVSTDAWASAYRALEKRSPGMDSITGYAATQVLLEGVKQANSAKGDAVSAALRKLQMKTLIGDWASDERGDMRDRKIFIYQVRNGRFEQIGEER